MVIIIMLFDIITIKQPCILIVIYGSHERWVYLGVKTYEVFHCFLAIIFLSSIVLTSRWLLYIYCLTSLVSFTGFYTERMSRKGEVGEDKVD